MNLFSVPYQSFGIADHVSEVISQNSNWRVPNLKTNNLCYFEHFNVNQQVLGFTNHDYDVKSLWRNQNGGFLTSKSTMEFQVKLIFTPQF